MLAIREKLEEKSRQKCAGDAGASPYEHGASDGVPERSGDATYCLSGEQL